MSAIRPLCLTWLPTRRCNLKCDYCGAYKRLPEYGPEGNQRVVEAIQDAFPDLTFWCLLGGDLTVWGEELIPFVKFLSDKKLFYGITSNSVWINQDRAERLMDAGLSNWTVSCDSLEGLVGGRGAKAAAARNAIDIFRGLGLKDIHCMVTVSRDTIEGTPAVVRWLSERGIWADVAPFIWGKHGYYDYSPHGPTKGLALMDEDVPRLRTMLNELLKMREEGFLVHNMAEYLAAWPDYIVRQDWKCRAPWNLMVDADGALKPCLHLFGKKTRDFTVWNIKERGWDAFLEAWKEDVAELCQGCFWNCQFEPEFIWQRTRSLDQIEKYFKHGSHSLDLTGVKFDTVGVR
jgi:MoaA/NifB/PqqE/SkfB family radical SAM enzyme